MVQRALFIKIAPRGLAAAVTAGFLSGIAVWVGIPYEYIALPAFLVAFDVQAGMSPLGS
ncbi:hypothetical protein [Streptomyces sp. NPDC058757]|uniref:hypothetical protein n=1 Tax=Streptomyces sp. NPDC058757 TaxID=3346626 RepID=UPI003685DB7C